MAIVETRVAAYITGASFSPNLSEQVDISAQQNGSQMETRYYCVLSATFETAYASGGKRPEPASIHVRLNDPVTGQSYRLTMWDMESIVKALPDAVLQAGKAGKVQFAGFDPNYPTYTVTKV